MFDNNPRGGLRGGKGIAISDGLISIANASHIFVYDHDWTLKHVATHPSCASNHDILAKSDTLWVASNRNDLIIQLSHDSKLIGAFNYRDHDDILDALGLKKSRLLDIGRNMIHSGSLDFRDPRTHSLDKTNIAHVNSMCFMENGDMLVSLGRLIPWKMAFLMKLKGHLTCLGVYTAIVAINTALIKYAGLKKQKNSELIFVPATGKSAILKVTPEGETSVLFQFKDITVPNHSLCPLDNGHVLYCDTNNGDLLVLDPEQCTVLKRIFVAEDFLRGIEPLSETLVAVGSKYTVQIVDINEGVVVKTIQIADDPRVAIFDIQVLPDDVGPLPEALAESLPNN